MNRRQLVLSIVAAPLVARAQTPPYAPGTRKRLGVLYLPEREVVESIPHNAAPLAALGWVEGQTLQKVRRFAEGVPSRFEVLSRELVAENVDVLLASGVPCTRAMQKATRTIPICAIVDDPIGNGFAKSMARPGGNITGLAEGYQESCEKEIELLRAAVPGIERLAVVSTSYDTAYVRANSQWLIKAAEKWRIAVDVHFVQDREDMQALLPALPPRKSAIYLRWCRGSDARRLASLATPRRVVLMGQEEELVDYGVLMTFRPMIAEDRQLASMLDRLLRGGNPAEIPFELPTRSVFAVNRKAAEALGIKLPADFLVRADKVV